MGEVNTFYYGVHDIFISYLQSYWKTKFEYIVKRTCRGYQARRHNKTSCNNNNDDDVLVYPS